MFSSYSNRSATKAARLFSYSIWVCLRLAASVSPASNASRSAWMLPSRAFRPTSSIRFWVSASSSALSSSTAAA